MLYSLVLDNPTKRGGKDFGGNNVSDQLSNDYPTYLFYYPGPILNQDLQTKLKEFGQSAGKNLFVNIAKLNDPNYRQIVNAFAVRTFPVIILTGVEKFASIRNNGNYSTAFIRLDNKNLLKNADKAIECIGELFNLLISEKISEASNEAKRNQRNATLSVIANTTIGTLKRIGKVLNDKDVSISWLEGKFEIKNRVAK